MSTPSSPLTYRVATLPTIAVIAVVLASLVLGGLPLRLGVLLIPAWVLWEWSFGYEISRVASGASLAEFREHFRRTHSATILTLTALGLIQSADAFWFLPDVVSGVVGIALGVVMIVTGLIGFVAHIKQLHWMCDALASAEAGEPARAPWWEPLFAVLMRPLWAILAHERARRLILAQPLAPEA